MITMSVRPCLYLLSALMASTGILMVGGGLWIVLDQQELGELIQGGEDMEKVVLYANKLTDSFQDSFSLFSLNQGWSKFGYVLIGMGLSALAVVFFGLCGFHNQEYICLCLLYITLIITFIILEIFAMILIKKRDMEIKVVVDKEFSDPRFTFFVFSFTISLATLVLAISLVLLIATTAKKYESFGQQFSCRKM
eukprot:GFUD01039291.1.p1 GENE.GFUD01039291.1~~GFUD01039291.1.p1  ORF type:complete len:194 (-),score=49.93 GFUD01039291.1:18-599(-)